MGPTSLNQTYILHVIEKMSDPQPEILNYMVQSTLYIIHTYNNKVCIAMRKVIITVLHIKGRLFTAETLYQLHIIGNSHLIFIPDTTKWTSTFFVHWKLEVWQRSKDPFFRYTYSEVWTISSAGERSWMSISRRNRLPSSLLTVSSKLRRPATEAWG